MEPTGDRNAPKNTDVVPGAQSKSAAAPSSRQTAQLRDSEEQQQRISKISDVAMSRTWLMDFGEPAMLTALEELPKA
eukprot:9632650-Alexandrium_andersonii.AAC.1